MASSGTLASPDIDFRFKEPSGREAVLVAGYMRIKSQAVLEAGDLSLRTIKTFQATPYAAPDHGSRGGGPDALYGSINTRGSMMNSITVNILRGSRKSSTSSGTSGVWHLGTVRGGGTYQVSFLALGG